MTEIQDTTGLDDILENANFNEINIAYFPMDNAYQRDETEELLDAASALTNDASGTQGIAPQYGVCGCMHLGLKPRVFSLSPKGGGGRSPLRFVHAGAQAPPGPLVPTPVVQLDHHGWLCFQKVKQPRKLKPRPKHPPKLHIWAAISKCGATSVVIFKGIMTSLSNCAILETALLPFIEQHIQMVTDSYRM